MVTYEDTTLVALNKVPLLLIPFRSPAQNFLCNP